MIANINYRILTIEDWQEYKAAYLEWLRDNPTVLATRYDEAVLQTDLSWQEMLCNPQLAIWGCFITDKLVAIASIAYMNWSIRYHESVISQLPASVQCERHYLSSVYNRPEYRGNGLMLDFVQHIIEYNQQKDLALIVEVNNIRAIKLYKKLGFEIIETLPSRIMGDNLPHSEYLMELRDEYFEKL